MDQVNSAIYKYIHINESQGLLECNFFGGQTLDDEKLANILFISFILDVLG